MHERNIYKQPPDFKQLSEKYETFKKYVRISAGGRGHLDFRDPEAVRELTYTLLKEDFKLKLEIPLDRLIPTLSLRLNYIHWIEDLLNVTKGTKDPESDIWGFDIGCGASCIYALLGARMNNWNFTASEIDELSFKYAANNINMNNLGDRIFLKKVKGESLLRDSLPESQIYDFCMCNPPFFGDKEEASGEASRTDRRTLPFSVSTATDSESITKGGEVEFVKKIIEESLVLKQKLRLYTSMLGKKKSLKILRQYLKYLRVPCITSTIFEQGKTARWGLCWSFQEEFKTLFPVPTESKPKINTAPFSFIIEKSGIEKLAEDSTQKALVDTNYVKYVCKEVVELLKELEINFEESSEFDSFGNFVYTLGGKAVENTWTRQRRQRRKRKKLEKDEKEKNEPGEVGPKGEVNLHGEDGPKDEVNLHGEDGSRNEVNLHGEDGPKDEVNLHGEDGSRNEVNLHGEDGPKDEVSLIGEACTKGDTSSRSEINPNEPQQRNKSGILPQRSPKHCDDICQPIILSKKDGDAIEEKNTADIPANWSTVKDGRQSTNESETSPLKDRKSSSTDNEQNDLAVSRKRTHDQINTSALLTDFLFKFKLKVGSNNAERNRFSNPVRCDVSCLEGSREGLHQLFLYLKNKFNGEQIHD